MSAEERKYIHCKALRRLDERSRLRLLDQFLGLCGDDETAPAVLALLDMAIVPVEERPSAGAPRLVRLLGKLRRRSRSAAHLNALASLLRHWSRLPENLRHVVLVAGNGRLTDAAGALAGSTLVEDRLAVCRVAAESGDTSLAGVLAALFTDPEASVASAAERALMGLCFRAAAIDPATGEGADQSTDLAAQGATPPDFARAVVGIMEVAARERRRPAVLGVMALLGPEPIARARAGHDDAVGRWMVGATEDALGALRNTLRWSDGPLARRRALEWLSAAPLAGAALERLARARSIAEHDCVLSRSHLLAHPGRARRAALLGGARAASGIPGFLPPPEHVASLSAGARRGLCRFVRAAGTGVGTCRRVVEPLLCDPDPVVRHACARVAPPAIAADLCFDADARVARSAMLSWSLVGERAGGVRARRPALRADAARDGLMLRLARSPHGAVRALAKQDLSLIAWLDPGPAGRAAARRRLAEEPEALVADLRALMMTGAPQDRVGAIMLARRLGLGGPLQRELLTLSELRDEGARVAATAVAALADTGGAEAAGALLRHGAASDPRVRANAVEAMGAMMRRGPAQTAHHLHATLLETKDDGHARTRANALRALLSGPPGAGPAARVYEPGAVSSLLAMLRDERPEHRLGGAWLAGRVLPFNGAARLGPRWTEVSVRVHELAESDRDPRVRVRAGQCADLMRSRLSAGAPARAVA